mgnify:FL=1
MEGQYVVNGALATPVVSDVPMLIPSTRNIDQMFTAGSILAESLKTVFKICPNGAEVYAVPRVDAGSSVKAVYTLTITGPATSDGQIDLFLGDLQYSIQGLDVTSTQSATAIAAAIVAAIPSSFPYVVTVAAGVITFTAKNAGTVGNFLNPVVNPRALQNYMPTGVSFAFLQTVVGSVDPAPINYATALGTCCYSIFALLSGSVTWQRGMRDYIRSAWDCSKPQCFGHGYTYNSGSLGTVLATGDNSAEFSRLAWKPSDVNFPWMVVAGYAARSACTACTSPELSIQGRTYGALVAIKRPQACATPWTYDEAQQLHDAGFVTYAPVGQGSGQYTWPYIVNDVTNYLYDDLGRPNATFRDANSRRLSASTAVKIATKLNEFNGIALYSISTKVPQGIFGTNKRLMLAAMHDWAKSNVGILFSEFENLENDLTLQTDFEVAPPCQGVPCKLHLNIRYKPPCRIANIAVQMQPALLDNCLR